MKMRELMRAGTLGNMRVLLVSKTEPQFGAGIKYSQKGTAVQYTLVPLVSLTGDTLAPSVPAKPIFDVRNIPHSLFRLLAQLHEYNSMWTSSDMSFSELEGKSTIGDLYIYEHT
tara:strand:- start:6676 stop:7017 length:342 start_codon:yes stop_codon:yes gene_type:complete